MSRCPLPPQAALAASAALAAGLLGACAESVAPKPPAAHVLAVSGGGQTGRTLDTLPQHLIVQVQDDAGLPVEGVAVRWAADDATARLIIVDALTRVDGTARVIVALGLAAGAKRITANVPGFDDGAVFELTAEARPVFKAVSLMRGPWSEHMCALDEEGRAWCWGYNGFGQLGNGFGLPAASVATPIPVQTTLRFTRLWGMWSSTCGLTFDHELWCWGANAGFSEGGIFGNGTTEPSAVPVLAGGGMQFRDVDFDLSFACGITLGDEAYCWGRGVMGDGTSARPSTVPVRVSGSERWREIAVEDSRVCAVDHDNSAFCWSEFDTQVAMLPGPALIPTRVPSVPPVMDLSLATGLAPSQQCALSANGGGVAVCWGWNGFQYPRPGGAATSRVTVGAETAMARTVDGRLWVWGGRPGCCDGYVSGTPVPLAPAGPWGDFAISSIGVFAILESDGGVYQWSGFPAFGPPGELLPLPVAPPELE